MNLPKKLIVVADHDSEIALEVGNMFVKDGNRYTLWHVEYGHLDDLHYPQEFVMDWLRDGYLTELAVHLRTELLAQAAVVRRHQREFFKHKKQEMLKVCKREEYKLDQLLAHPELNTEDPAVSVVQDMRETQRDYFRSRGHLQLAEARFLESELDKILGDRVKTAPTGFSKALPQLQQSLF
jgi:hypothetical protein